MNHLVETCWVQKRDQQPTNGVTFDGRLCSTSQ